MRYRKAVFIVVYRKARPRFCKSHNILYLVLKRKLHWRGYEFPKGAIEKNENLLGVMKRELFEETGQRALKIKRFNLHGKYKYHRILEDRPGYIGQTWKLFAAEVKSSRIKIDKKEHSGYKWLNFRDAVKKIKFNDQKKCLNAVNSCLYNASKNRKRVEKS